MHSWLILFSNAMDGIVQEILSSVQQQSIGCALRHIEHLLPGTRVWCSNILRAIDPNHSYFMLRAAFTAPNLRANAISSLSFEINKLAKNCIKDLCSSRNYPFTCILKYEDQQEILGHQLVHALNQMVYLESPVKAFKHLATFTNVSEYLDLGCSSQERPRLCIEVSCFASKVATEYGFDSKLLQSIPGVDI